MDNINVYYDNHRVEEFLHLLPVIAFEFSKKVKLFYHKRYRAGKLVFNNREYSEKVELKEFKEVMKLKNIDISKLRLMQLVYDIQHLSTDYDMTQYYIGVMLGSSYKRVYITPEHLDRFDGSMVKHEREKLQLFQLELFDSLIEATDPSYINTADDQFCSYENPEAEYEYVKDPYWLAVELIREWDRAKDEYYINKKDGQWKLLEQIKKVITVEEIVEICYKYAKYYEGYYIKYYPVTGGIARFSLGNYSAHYPRYFIREELRKRAINIPEGRSEEDMKSSLGKLWHEKDLE